MQLNLYVYTKSIYIQIIVEIKLMCGWNTQFCWMWFGMVSICEHLSCKTGWESTGAAKPPTLKTPSACC